MQTFPSAGTDGDLRDDGEMLVAMVTSLTKMMDKLASLLATDTSATSSQWRAKPTGKIQMTTMNATRYFRKIWEMVSSEKIRCVSAKQFWWTKS
jgi:hypothetical protein